MQFAASQTITKMTQERAMNRVTIMNEVVKRAVDNKEVVTSSTELLSAMIFGYFHTASTFLLEHPHSKNFQKWSDESFNFFWKGIN